MPLELVWLEYQYIVWEIPSVCSVGGGGTLLLVEIMYTKEGEITYFVATKNVLQMETRKEGSNLGIVIVSVISLVYRSCNFGL